VAFSPDGKMIATSGIDGAVILWSWPEAREIRHMQDMKFRLGVQRLAFSPDSRTLAVSAWFNSGDSFFLFDVHSGRLISRFGKDRQGQGPVRFLRGGQELLTTHTDGSMAVWEASSGKFLRSIGDHKERLDALEPGPDDGHVWWVTRNSLGLRDLATGKDLKVFSHNAYTPFLRTRLCVSASGNWLAVGNRVWDATTGKAITHGMEDIVRHGHVDASAISPDGRLFAFPWGRDIVLWEALGQCKMYRLSTGVLAINDLAFSPDGTVLAAAGPTGALLWDLTGRLRAGRLQPVTLSKDEMESCWNALGGDDAGAAQHAAWTLAAGGEAAVSFLAQRVRPARAPDPGEVSEIRSRLKDPNYDVREIAARTLLDFGLPLPPEERELLRRPDVRPDMRAHLLANGQFAQREPKTPTLLPPPVLLPLPERLRSTRALGALERSLSPAAIGLLGRLVDGAPEAPFTQEAKRTLARMRHP
jgi:hypothetical protein